MVLATQSSASTNPIQRPCAAFIPAFLAEERPPFGFEISLSDFPSVGERIRRPHVFDPLNRRRQQSLPCGRQSARRASAGILDEEFHVEGGNDHGERDLVGPELMHGMPSFSPRGVGGIPGRAIEFAQDGRGQAGLISCSRT